MAAAHASGRPGAALARAGREQAAGRGDAGGGNVTAVAAQGLQPLGLGCSDLRFVPCQVSPTQTR